jgi:Domain of unknwon function (DUF3824)
MKRAVVLLVMGLAGSTGALAHDHDHDRDQDRYERHRDHDRDRYRGGDRDWDRDRYRPAPRYWVPAPPRGYVYDPYRGGYRYVAPGYPPPGWGWFIALR